MRELITWAVALVFYGFGLGVLQVPNPKRVIASRVFFVLGALSASGASIMWITSLSDTLWIRLIVSFIMFGLIGAGTIEAIRFAGHTQEITPLPVQPDTKPTPMMSNAELKQEVLKFVGELRNFNDRVQSVAPQDLSNEKNEALKATKSQKKQQEISKRYSERELEAHRKWMELRQREYDNNYFAKTEAFKIMLFNRIPNEKLEGNRPQFFRNLAGNRPIIQIAADFERLANLLD